MISTCAILFIGIPGAQLPPEAKLLPISPVIAVVLPLIAAKILTFGAQLVML
jgi:hypothetical protein